MKRQSKFGFLSVSIGIAFSTVLSLAPVAGAQQSASDNLPLNEAQAFEAKGQFEQAISKYREALDKEPASESIKAALLGLYCKTEPKSKAERELRLGQAAQFLGNEYEAVEHYRKALFFSPNDKEVERILKGLRPNGVTPISIAGPQQKKKTVSHDSQKIADALFMEKIQRVIRGKWNPPRRSLSQKVVVFFKLGGNGELKSSRISSSSGDAEMDAAALAAVRNSQFPKPPDGDSEILFTFDYFDYGRKSVVSQTFTPDGVPTWRPTAEDCAKLHLDSENDRQTERNYAEYFVRAGELSRACELYKNLINATNKSGNSTRFEKATQLSEHGCVLLFLRITNTPPETNSARSALECLQALDKAKTFTKPTIDSLQKQLIDCIISSHASLVELTNGLDKQPGIRVELKLSFAELLYKAAVSSHAEKEVILEIAHHRDSYKATEKQLVLADGMEKKAFKCEIQGDPQMAVGLYRQASEIKRKELGALHEETLLENANIARALYEMGRNFDSKRTYQATISSFKKAAISNSDYATLLENYGNMLNQIGQTQQASKIYDEARALAKKLSS